jgi:2-polyprenyl-6-methoxyphenol hydroxylase-like FAD-dependent oxidoreductase
MTSRKQRFGKAIVIGNSIAGLVSARVLTDHFDEVVILERDARPEGPSPRKGVPQAHHIHVLLEGALVTLRALFPGIDEEAQRAGAGLVDVARDYAWHHYGGWKPRFHSGIESLSCTRPFLEHHIRQRVEALRGVTIRYQQVAEELIHDAARGRVTGARIRGPDGAEETLSADLVLDASGRGSRAPRWLEALGYGAPEEERVGIDLVYTSRLYDIPASFSGDWRAMAAYSRTPAGRRSGLLSEVEGHRWIVSLSGYFGDHPPTDDAGFLEFARSLPAPDLYDAIKDASPVTPAARHKIPSSRWFHYEKLARLPDGLVILGDAVCSLNPLYGQGMTAAVMEAKALAEGLERAKSLHGFTQKFQQQVAAFLARPWMLSTVMDLRYPEAEGARPPWLAAAQWTLGNLIDLTSADAEACRLFLEVYHMRRGMGALLSPGFLASFLAYSAKSLVTPLPRRVRTGTVPLVE